MSINTTRYSKADDWRRRRLRRLCVLICLMLTGVGQAAVILSNGTGGGDWSSPASWVGGIVPADGDSVMIAAGDIVTFNANMSTWATGVADLTIDGTLVASTSPGTYTLKTSGDIVLEAHAQLNAGSAEMAYPLDCTFTIDFNGTGNSIECGLGGTINFYCMQPTYQWIGLSVPETIGQTVLSVDTDVTGDIWKAGDTIHIDDIDNGLDSEERIIAASGIAADTITVTAGLTKAKIDGAKVILITRNIRIINSTNRAINYAESSVIGAEINCTNGVGYSTSNTISGTFNGCDYTIFYGSGNTFSGVISGCDYGLYLGSNFTADGLVSGCAHGVYLGCANIINCTISGCTYGITYGSFHVISGTIIGCSGGIYSGSGYTITGNLSNSRNLMKVPLAKCYNTVFDRGKENYGYNTDDCPAWSYVESYDHNGEVGTFKAWTRGGVIESDFEMVPENNAISYRHMCEDANHPCFRQETTTVEPSETLYVTASIFIVGDHSAYPPVLEIIDPGADPLVEADNVPLSLNTVAIADGSATEWQDVTIEYTNNGIATKPVIVRCSAMNNGCEIYEVWKTLRFQSKVLMLEN